jgi:hypothetical protein
MAGARLCIGCRCQVAELCGWSVVDGSNAECRSRAILCELHVASTDEVQDPSAMCFSSLQADYVASCLVDEYANAGRTPNRTRPSPAA